MPWNTTVRLKERDRRTTKVRSSALAEPGGRKPMKAKFIALKAPFHRRPRPGGLFLGCRTASQRALGLDVPSLRIPPDCPTALRWPGSAPAHRREERGAR